jgi:hypothetical protein
MNWGSAAGQNRQTEQRESFFVFLGVGLRRRRLHTWCGVVEAV